MARAFYSTTASCSNSTLDTYYYNQIIDSDIKRQMGGKIYKQLTNVNWNQDSKVDNRSKSFYEQLTLETEEWLKDVGIY